MVAVRKAIREGRRPPRMPEILKRLCGDIPKAVLVRKRNPVDTTREGRVYGPYQRSDLPSGWWQSGLSASTESVDRFIPLSSTNYSTVPSESVVRHQHSVKRRRLA